MTIYAFYSGGIPCQKFKSVSAAIQYVNGDESRVFVSVGLPNPWFVHPIKNGKVLRDKVITPGKLEAKRRKFKKQYLAQWAKPSVGHNRPSLWAKEYEGHTHLNVAYPDGRVDFLVLGPEFYEHWHMSSYTSSTGEDAVEALQRGNNEFIGYL